MSSFATTGRLVVGTRGSLLARAQTQWVIDQIRQAHPGLDVVMEIISTRGDRDQVRPLPEIGGKGLFTEELERALLDGSIDLAVHSIKDLPTDLQPGLALLTCPQREDPRDAWLSADGLPFEQLAPNSVVGTSSLRRQAQLLMRRPDLTFVQLRGNVDTRIRKVQRGDCAGAVLAMAGLIRAGLAAEATHAFEPAAMLPAPGQGALGLEGRADDQRVRECLQAIHHEPTAIAVQCERAILHELNAGCRAPVAVYAHLEGNEILCDALVIDPQGSRPVRATARQPLGNPQQLVEEVVGDLCKGGAQAVIAACRQA